MKVFTDTKNRKWDCSVTVATTKRVRAALDVNLIALLQDDGGKGYGALVADEVKFTEVLYWVVKPQADSLGVDDFGFCEGFDESVLLDSEAALYEGLVDFFRDPKKRELLRALRRKSKEVSRLVTEKAFPRVIQEVDSVNQQAEADKILAKMEKELQELKAKRDSQEEKSKNSFSNVPASVP